jgi:8-oxo-dGTP pyrophosphatase MutT (NUDIX family)
MPQRFSHLAPVDAVADPAKADPAKADPAKADPAKTEAAKSDPVLADFLARARARLDPPFSPIRPPSHSDNDLAHYDLAEQEEADGDAFPVARPAAVLFALLPTLAGAQVLFTQRPTTMANHPGQIALPGGKIDPTDQHAVAAALREAEEEIGLAPSEVEVIGQAAPYQTGTGFIVTPVIGLVRPGFVAIGHPYEVEDVFETPLGFLMDPANHERHQKLWKGKMRSYFAMPWGDRYIWGATAGIIRALYERLYEQRETRSEW